MRFPTHLTTRVLAVASSACSPAVMMIQPHRRLIRHSDFRSRQQDPSSIRVTFNGRAIDDSYTIERAEGTAGTFARVTTVNAPATDGTVTLRRHRPQRPDAVPLSREGDAWQRQQHVWLRADARRRSRRARSRRRSLATSRPTRRGIAIRRTSLNGFIHVANGATLTIESGTTIKGDFNTRRLVAVRPSRRKDHGDRHGRTCRSCSRRRSRSASGSLVTGAA